MPDDKLLKNVYDALINVGYDNSSLPFEKFKENILASPENRKSVYNALANGGYESDLPFDEFNDSILKSEPQAKAVKQVQPSKPQKDVEIGTAFPLTVGYGKTIAPQFVDAYTRFIENFPDIVNTVVHFTGELLSQNRGINTAGYGIGSDAKVTDEQRNEIVKGQREITQKILEHGVQTSKAIRDFGYKAGIKGREFDDNLFNKVIGQTGQLSAQVLVSLIPGVGVGLASYSAIAMESQKLAEDIYDATAEHDKDGNIITGTGNLDAAMVGYVAGIPLGATDIVSFKMFGNMLTKEGKPFLNNLMTKGFKETLANANTVKGLGLAYGKSILTETGQEVGQTFGEQATKNFVGTLDGIDWNEIQEVATITPLATGLFGVAPIQINHARMTEANKYLTENVPQAINEKVKLGIITEDRGKEILANIKNIQDNPENFTILLKEHNNTVMEAVLKTLPEDQKSNPVFVQLRNKIKENSDKAGFSLSEDELDATTWTNIAKMNLEIKNKVGVEETAKKEVADRFESLYNSKNIISDIEKRRTEELNKILPPKPSKIVAPDWMPKKIADKWIAGEISNSQAIESVLPSHISKEMQDRMRVKVNEFSDGTRRYSVPELNQETSDREFGADMTHTDALVEMLNRAEIQLEELKGNYKDWMSYHWEDIAKIDAKYDAELADVQYKEPIQYTDMFADPNTIGMLKNEVELDKQFIELQSDFILKQELTPEEANAKTHEYFLNEVVPQSKEWSIFMQSLMMKERLEEETPDDSVIFNEEKLNSLYKEKAATEFVKDPEYVSKAGNTVVTRKHFWDRFWITADDGKKYQLLRKRSLLDKPIPGWDHERIVKYAKKVADEYNQKHGTKHVITDNAGTIFRYKGLKPNVSYDELGNVVYGESESYDEKKITSITDESKNTLKELAQKGEPFKIQYESQTSGLSERLIRNVILSEDGTQAYAEQYNAKEDIWEKRTYTLDNRLKSIKGIQTMAQAEKVAQNVSNEVTEQNSELTGEQFADIPESVSEILTQLEKDGFANTATNPLLVQQILQKAGNVQVALVPQDFVVEYYTDENGKIVPRTMKDNNAMLYKDRHGKFIIYVNEDNLDQSRMYNSIVHEGFHYILRSFLDPKSPLHSVKFRLDLEELMNDFYKIISKDPSVTEDTELLAELDRVFGIKNIDRRAEEFLVHMLSGTSPGLTRLAKATMIKVNKKPTSVWKRFIKFIADFWNSKFPEAKMNFYNAIESIVSYNTSIKLVDDIWNSGKIELLGTDALNEAFDNFEKIEFEATTGEVDLKSLRTIGKLLYEGTNASNPDYIAFLKTLSLKQIESYLGKNENWNRGIKQYFEAKIKRKYDVSEEYYKQHIIRSIWRGVNQVKHYPTVRLVGRQERQGRSYTVETFTGGYRDNNNGWKDGYQTITRLDQRAEQFSKALGVELEVAYINQVYEITNGKTTTWKINSVSMSIPARNKFVSNELRKAGYYFLGTFSDKSTVCTFKLKDKTAENEKILQENLQKIKENYIQLAQQCEQVLLQSGKINPKDAGRLTAGLAEARMQHVMRVMLEDAKIGGRMVEGVWQSALYNPENPATYDLIKLLKRSIEVAPLSKTYVSKEDNTNLVQALEKANMSYGISVNPTTGDIEFNSVIFNSNSISEPLKVTVGGKEFSFTLQDILKNSYGTETTDGIVFWSNGARMAYTDVHKTLKPSVVKAFIGNNLEGDFSSPLFVKSSFQLTNSDLLEKWMKDNNVSMLISDTSAKINMGYDTVDLLGTVDTYEGEKIIDRKSFNIPLSAINRQSEKDIIKNDAKGLAQSFTSNLMASDNPFFQDKGIRDTVESILNRLNDDYRNTMAEITPEEILGYVIERAYNTSSTIEAERCQLLLDFFLDDKLSQFIADDIEKEGKSSLNKFNAMRRVARNSYGALYEPIFKEIFERFAKTSASKIYNFRVPASWSTLRPDLGWLEPKNVEQILNNLKQKFIPGVEALEAEKAEYEEKYDYTKDPKELNRISKHISALEKRIKSISSIVSQMAEEEAWKEFENIVDVKTGRLKKGYCYLEKGYHNKFDMNPFDKVIATVVPSDGMTSQQAVKVAAFLEDVDENVATFNSEHTQTIVGRDFDIDTIHLMFRDKRYFTYETYDQMWNTIEESNNVFIKEALKVYRTVLNDKTLTEKDIMSKGVHLAFMQAIYGKSEGSNVYSLGSDLYPMNDKFAKDIGSAINQRKIFTTALQIGVTSSFNGIPIGELSGKQIAQAYIMLMRLTNDKVDSPTNDNMLFYTLNDVTLYNMLHGTEFEPGKESDTIVKGLNTAERFLFYYGNKITSDRNLEDRDEDFTLTELATYIATQQQINKAIDAGDNNALVNMFKDWVSKFKNVKEEEFNIAVEYLQNVTFDRKSSDSFALAAVNKIDLSLMPNVSMTQSEYGQWQRRANAMMLASDKVLTPGFRALREQALKLYDIYRHQGIPLFEDGTNQLQLENKQNAELIRLASLPSALWHGNVMNRDLADLQFGIINHVYPIPQFYDGETKTVRFLQNLQTLSSPEVYAKSIAKMFEANAVVYHYGTKKLLSADNATFEYEGRKIILAKNGKQDLKITLIGRVGNEFVWNSLKEFNGAYNDPQQKTAKFVFDAFTKENGIFSKASERFKFSKVVNLSASVPLGEKIELAVDYIKERINTFSEDEQLLLWQSMMGFPDEPKLGATEKDTTVLDRAYNVVKQNPGKRFTHSTTYDIISRFPSGKKFLKGYARALTESFKGMSFGTSINTRRILSEAWFADSETEIWDERKANQTVPSNWKDNLIKGRNGILDMLRTVVATRHVDSPKEAVGSVINLSGDSLKRDITAEQVVKSVFSRDLPDTVFKNGADTSLEHIAFAKQNILEQEYSAIIAKEMTSNTAIYNIMENKIIRETSSIGKHEVKFVKQFPFLTVAKKAEHEELRKKYSERAIYYVEEDKIAVTNVSISNGSFVYRLHGVDYTSLESLEGAVYQIFKDINTEGFDAKKETAAYMIAIELKKMDVRNIEYINKVLAYLEDFKAENLDTFQDIHMLETMIAKYSDLKERFINMKGIYYPHMYKKGVYRSILIENIMKKNSKLSLHEAEILADKQMSRIAISTGNFSDYVYGFQLRRTLKDDERRYEREDFSAMANHQAKLMSSIRNDLMYLHAAEYENDARRMGSEDKIINSMMEFFKAESKGNNMFRKVHITASQSKVGERVSFYAPVVERNYDGSLVTKEKYIRGYLEKIDKDRIYLSMDKDVIERAVRSNLDMLKRVQKGLTDHVEPRELKWQPSYSFFYKDLVVEGYVEANKEYTTANQLLNDIITGLEAKLADKANWGSYSRKDIHTKAFRGIALTNFYDALDVEREDGFFYQQFDKRVGEAMDTVFDATRTLLSGAMLGSTSGGVTNYLDGMYGLIRNIGRKNYYMAQAYGGSRFIGSLNAIFKGKKREDIISSVKGILTKGEEEIQKTLGYMKNPIKVEDMETEEQFNLIKSHVLQYIFENGLVVNKQINTESLMDQIKDIRDNATTNKFMNLLKGASSVLTYPFGYAETAIRIRSAYVYAYKAIVLDKINDSESIHRAIWMGVSRSQGLYSALYRRLEERTKAGKLRQQFTQYTFSQMQVFKSDLDARKLTGETLKDIFKKGSITQDMARQIFYDLSFGIGLQTMFPGMRIGNPITRPIALAVSLLGNAALMGLWDDREEKDMRDLVFNLIAFRYGVGITMPISLLWNILAEEESIAPIHPRISTLTYMALLNLYNSIMGEDPVYRSTHDRLIANQSKMSKYEKALLGFNLFSAGDAKNYLSEKENEYYNTPLIPKLESIIIEPRKTATSFIPAVNLMRWREF